MTTSTEPRLIVIDVAPPIRGLRFRHWAGEADLSGMFVVNQAARLADGELEPVGLEEMTNHYRHLTNSDLDHDLLVVELDGRIVGYARVEWADSNDGERWYEATCLLDPAVRRRGIGRAMLAWTEGRRRAIHAQQVEADAIGGRPTALTTFVFDADAGGHALLQRSGYTPHRRFFEMVRPNMDAIRDLPLPAGLEVRTFGPDRDPALFRRVFDADVEAFRDHYGWVDDSDREFDGFLAAPDVDPSLWVVAFDGEEVAGGILNAIRDSGAGPVDGWLDSVFTRRPWRRQGLARALIARSLELLRSRGATRALLGVDATNPNQALQLYESCGFEVASSATAYRKPIEAAAP
jgi:mycothiol synthase